MISKNLKKLFSSAQNISIKNSEPTFFEPANLKFSKIASKTEEGQKNNLICLHGFMGSQSNFRSIVRNQKINNLANAFLLDQRNHGISQHKPTMTMPEMAYDLKHFIEENQIEDNIVLMGHSMGGRVLMTFLQDYPELYSKIKGSIILDILPDDYMGEKNPTVMETYVMVSRLNEMNLANKSLQQIREEILNIAGNKDIAGFLAMQIEEVQSGVINQTNKFRWKCNLPAFQDGYRDMISHVTHTTQYEGPLQVICGERSTYANQEQAEKSFARLFKNFDKDQHLEFIKGAGHWVHAENPAYFIDKVSGCLQQWLHTPKN